MYAVLPARASRRDILQILGVGATTAALPNGAQIMPGPFAADDVASHLIPAVIHNAVIL